MARTEPQFKSPKKMPNKATFNALVEVKLYEKTYNTLNDKE
jgi:hypothetical protein